MTTNVVPIGQRIPEWSFADRIRKVRRDAGLTQAEFASKLGYNSRQLAHWESGRSRPDDIVEAARRIWREFRVPSSWTLDISDPGDGGGSASTDE